MHDGKEIRRALEEMGVERDSTLLVHSSFKSVGPFKGGPEALLDAFASYMSEGLLVFPTLSYNDVNSKTPVCNVLSTPSCVGALSELFRKREGVLRSWHPTHSVAALGRDAAAFVEGHERFDTPCARQSPWGRLVDRGAKILFLGTGISCNTFLHGVEEWNSVPGSFGEGRQELSVIAPDGRVIAVPSRRHAGQRSRFYGKMERPFLESGAMVKGRAGDAACHLGDARRMKEVVERLFEIDLDLFGHDGLPDLDFKAL